MAYYFHDRPLGPVSYRRRFYGPEKNSPHAKYEREAYCKYAQDQYDLGQTLEDLSRAARGQSALMHAVSAAQSQHARTLNYLDDRGVNRMKSAWCPPHARDLAHKVFDIPELLEMKLSCLSMRELLQAQCINRQFRDAVDSSTKLQRRLMLAPQSSGYFFTPFMPCTPSYSQARPREYLRGREEFGIKVEHVTPNKNILDRSGRGEEVTLYENQLVVRIKVYPEAPELIPVGSRMENMQLAQPAITELTLLFECCFKKEHEDFYCVSNRQHYPDGHDANDDAWSAPQHKLIVPEGVTVGHVVWAFEMLKQAHRGCGTQDYELSWQMGYGYSTGASVKFQGVMQLEADDPAHESQFVRESCGCCYDGEACDGPQFWDRSEEAEKERDMAHDKMLETFHYAYKKAGRKGEPVPNMRSWARGWYWKSPYVSGYLDEEEDSEWYQTWRSGAGSWSKW